jgi:hypothetical protein
MPVLQNSDPEDPIPRQRPAPQLQPVDQNSDPEDPIPRQRGASRLPPAGAPAKAKAPRGKRVRRDRPAEKAARGRAGSRRR